MKKVIFSLLAMAALAGCPIEDDEGDYSISWAITVDGQSGSCAQVGASAVQFTSTLSDTGDIFVDTFRNCGAGSGVTGPMPIGHYNVVARLLDGDTPFGPSVTFTIDVVRNQTTLGGTAVFPFAFPDATFTVQMGGVPQNNCTESGAGVVFEEVEVYDAGKQQCLNIFDITGVTNESNQQVTVRSCELFLCQFGNTVHRLRDLDPGTYDIRVLGYKGSTSNTAYVCYASAFVRFDVGGSDKNLGVIVAPFTDLIDSRCNAVKAPPPTR